MNKMFETASFMIVKPCNMKCKFCYDTFNNMEVKGQIPKEEAFIILDKLKAAGLEKITFAGGEPLLYKWIYEVICYSKSIGLTTSIITNGSLLTDELLKKFQGKLDWIGVSIDSLNPETNAKSGRNSKLNPDYRALVTKIKSHGFRLKINTVVHRYNESEIMQDFINWANPDRWKIFDTLKVEGQNDKEFNGIRSSFNGFELFLMQNKHSSMVIESNDKMRGSYLLIDPQGRLYEDSTGEHTYSSKLQENPIEKCLAELKLDREKFINRGGLYQW